MNPLAIDREKGNDYSVELKKIEPIQGVVQKAQQASQALKNSSEGTKNKKIESYGAETVEADFSNDDGKDSHGLINTKISNLMKKNLLLEQDRNAAIKERNALRNELQELQMKLKNVDGDTLLKEEIAKLNAELNEIKSSHEIELATTVVGQEMENSKKLLKELDDKLTIIIAKVIQAVLKNEVSQDYIGNEQQLYLDAKQSLDQFNTLGTTLSEQVQKNKTPFLKAMERGNTLADNSNENQVLLDSVEHKMKFLEKSITTPNHIKTYSCLVNDLLKSVNDLIARDYIDSANYKKLSPLTSKLDLMMSVIPSDPSKKLSESDSAKKTVEEEKSQHVKTKILYDKEITRSAQSAALDEEAKDFAKTLKIIKEFKASNLEVKESQESSRTKISFYFNQLNEVISFLEKGLPTNCLKNYEIHQNEKGQEVKNKLISTQESTLAAYKDLRLRCSTTWNKTINDSNLLETHLDILNDRVGVLDNMDMVYNEVGVLKNNAVNALAKFTGNDLDTKFKELKPAYKEIHQKLTLAYQEYVSVVLKYESKIADISKKIKSPGSAFEKDLELQAIHAELPKAVVLKSIIDTHLQIKQIYEKQLESTKNSWKALYNRFLDTSNNFDTIDYKVNPDGFLTSAVKTVTLSSGIYRQKASEIVKSVANLSASTSSTRSPVETAAKAN